MSFCLSAHQPAYLPWLGYLEKIARADVFIYLDSVQFEKNSFTNRNRIKSANGVHWLTVPVRSKDHLLSTMAVLEVDESQSWREKHLKSIAASYAKAPDFQTKFSRLESLYYPKISSFSEICWHQLQFWLQEFGIDTPVIRSSQLPEMGKKSDLVLNLCRHFSADEYLSGKLGRAYLKEADFTKHSIKVSYQDFKPQPYPQLHGEFVPGLAVVDIWMNSSEPLFQFFKQRGPCELFK
ncbi:WbqC family protein [Chromobacterium haemolyticum]|uniref:WbqC family protein n=1 Tax=Chromobacterium haemolyticum TaxID=394935 RepID=UPI00193BB8A3